MNDNTAPRDAATIRMEIASLLKPAGDKRADLNRVEDMDKAAGIVLLGQELLDLLAKGRAA